MKRIAIATTSRADYGIYRPLLERLAAQRQCRMHIIAGGAHISEGTIDRIRSDGYTVDETVDCLLACDTAAATTAAMGLAVAGFGRALDRVKPDLLLVLGDRFEMHAAALAALPLRVPVGHIHGGELTLGAIDDSLRHSMTKLSHIHFPATAAYARRIRQMGEPAERIFVCGALGLDHMAATPRMDRQQLRKQYGVTLPEGYLLVTFHPPTLEAADVETQTRRLFDALIECGRPIVFTRANADAGGRRINAMIDGFIEAHPAAQVADNLGAGFYFNAMRLADAMVGNSSSGIIEAPAARVPVVNIGSRQDGRLRAANVIDVPCDSGAILGAIHRALSCRFRQRLAGMVNPYGEGGAAARILSVLDDMPPAEVLLRKPFADIEPHEKVIPDNGEAVGRVAA